jgi:hypothetical protein
MLQTLLGHNVVVQSAAMVRRSAVLTAGGYRRDLRAAEDYDLWLRLALYHPFVYTNRTTAGYRIHPGQASRNEAALSRGACEARHRIWQVARYRLSPEELRDIEDIMLRAWDRSIRVAWRVRDTDTLRAVMALHPLVPDSEALRREWLWRIVLFRWPWRAAATLWDALGPQVQARLARVKRIACRPRPEYSRDQGVAA